MKNIIGTILGYAVVISFFTALLSGIVIASIGIATGQETMHEFGFLLFIAPIVLAIVVGIPAVMITTGIEDERRARQHGDYGW